MSENTKIEWTDATWNPIRGCTRVSAGCMNCYAERVAHRFSGTGQTYEGLTTKGANGDVRWTGEVRVILERMMDPLKRRRPTMYFVNSMSDLFHPSVPDAMIAAVFGIMAACPQHTFQILTKRPERIAPFFAWLDLGDLGKGHQTWTCALAAAKMLREPFGQHVRRVQEATWPLSNVWLGVSCEDQAAADERIPHLLRAEAAVRFLSMEPLLGPVELCGWLMEGTVLHSNEMQSRALPRIDWVIVGGESGPGARPMRADWARAIRDQCVRAGVPFFFKQWGGEAKKAAGRELDGREWSEFPNTDTSTTGGGK